MNHDFRARGGGGNDGSMRIMNHDSRARDGVDDWDHD